MCACCRRASFRPETPTYSLVTRCVFVLMHCLDTLPLVGVLVVVGLSGAAVVVAPCSCLRYRCIYGELCHFFLVYHCCQRYGCAPSRIVCCRGYNLFGGWVGGGLVVAVLQLPAHVQEKVARLRQRLHRDPYDVDACAQLTAQAQVRVRARPPS